ncbi:TIR domain-containing protein [Actinoplanes sp. NBRC 101535]|uniref:toll/interleukin-1 receptor domain-containing protein n=1 Tax=Actinoplanes sp. NBRC 101535 TaxID=3032196 RepID=UPI00255304A7|nr:TIR domain-containing protein [Actinoplanes sp. NBRC 101535]
MARGYDAFISYARVPDAGAAEELRRGLHGFARPWFRMRALRVFLDAASLSASPDLERDLQRCLDRSRFLIVLASPASARSRWVAKEIEYWLATRSPDHIVLVRTGGTLHWADGRFTASDAVSPALAGAFPAEPTYLDAPAGMSPDVIAKISARVRGRDVDELYGEDVREHRKAVRIRRVAIALLTTLAVVASVTAVLAVRRSREASSRQLAAQSVQLRPSRLDLALLLAVRAVALAPTDEARGGLLGAVLESGRGVRRFLRAPGDRSAPFDLRVLAVSAAGQWVAGAHCPAANNGPGDAGSTDGRIFVWPVTGGDGTPIVLPAAEGDTNVCELAFGPDGRFLLARDASGRVRLWEPQAGTGRIVAEAVEDESETALIDGAFAVRRAGAVVFLDPRTGADLATVPGVAAVTGGGRVVVIGADGRLRIRDGARLVTGPALGIDAERGAVTSADGRRVGLFAAGRAVVADTATGRAAAGYPTAAVAMALSPRGDRIALAESGGRVVVHGGGPDRDVRVPVPAGMTVGQVVFSPSGKLISVTAGGGAENLTVRFLLDAATGALRKVHWTPWARFSTDESALIGWGDTGITSERLTRPVPDEVISSSVGGTAASPDGRRLALGTADGVLLWDLDEPGERPALLPGSVGGAYAVAFDGTGELLVAVGAGGTPTVWQVDRTGPPFRLGAVPELPGASSPILINDGAAAAAMTADGTAVAWDTTTGREQWRLPLPGAAGATGITVARDGTRIAVSHSSFGRSGLDHRTGTYAAEIPARLVTDLPGEVMASSDGRVLVGVDGRTNEEAVVYRGDGTRIRSFRLDALPRPYPLSTVLSPDGRMLAASDHLTGLAVYGTSDGRVRIRCPALFGPSVTGGGSMRFTPDGTRLAVSGQDGQLHLVDTTVGTCTEVAAARLSGDVATFSHDGRTLVTTDGEIVAADTLAVLGTDPDPYGEYAFSADDRHLIHLDGEGATRRIPVADDALTSAACAAVGRGLTETEWRRFAVPGAFHAGCR